MWLPSGVSEPPRHILLAVDSLQIGGAEWHVVDLARALKTRGLLPSVVASCGGPLARELVAVDVPVRVLGDIPLKRRVDLGYARAIHEILVMQRVDVIHAHLFASAAGAMMAARAAGVPLVVTEHSAGTWQGISEVAAAGTYARGAGRVIAVSGEIEHRLVEVLGVSQESVTVIPNAIPPGVPLCPVREPHRAERDRPIVGIVGRLCPEKGVDLFLEAAARLRAGQPEARFLVVGDGPQRDWLEARARHLGLDGHVNFVGAVTSAREAIAELDVLLVPSRTDGTPLVVLEAQVAGVPVVASRVGGIPEQIDSLSSGVLVPAGDVDALVHATHTVLGNPLLRARIAAGGRARVAAWTHEAMVERVLTVYKEAAVASVRGVGPVPHSGERRQVPIPRAQ
jgi:glycosyltransferase involved in cell wall biosynthesis